MVINTVDCESYERDHDKLTEFGLACFETKDMRATSSNIGPYAENLFKQVYFYHYRVAPNAHLINTKFCRGDPTKNRFGQTRFVSISESKNLLNEAFNWPMDPSKPELGNCPVVFLGHAIHNDLQMLRNSFDFKPEVFDAVVRTIDTQNLARETGIQVGNNQIGLRRLCDYHGFEFRDSHTAGNDTAYTLFNAVLMVLDEESKGVSVSGECAQSVVDSIEDWSQNQEGSTWGVAVYCTRCDSRKHFKENCRARVACEKCQREKRKGSYSHKTTKCSWRN